MILSQSTDPSASDSQQGPLHLEHLSKWLSLPLDFHMLQAPSTLHSFMMRFIQFKPPAWII